MPLDPEVGLGAGHIVHIIFTTLITCVRCGPSSPQGGGTTAPAPLFGSCMLWLNGLMDQDATWYTEVGLVDLGDNVLGWDPAPNGKGTAAPTFRPMSIVAKRLDGSNCHFVQR